MTLNSAQRIIGRIRNRHFIFIDLLSFLFTPIIVIFLRYEGNFAFGLYERELLFVTVIFIVIKFIIFFTLGIYRRYWKLASIDELAHLIIVGLYILFLEVLAIGVLRISDFWSFDVLPYSIAILDAFVTMMFVSASRFSIRLLERAVQRISPKNGNGTRVLIVGAGAAGVMVASEIQSGSKQNLIPVGFIDDDISKINLRIRGLSVLGPIEKLPDLIVEYSIKKIIIAMPAASGELMRRINQICSNIDVQIQTLPSIYEIIDGKVNINKLRNIHIEDLLRREAVKPDDTEINKLLENKTILISGAGGSIGSEIVRQILKANPDKIILLGHGENSIFEIEQELKDKVLRKEIPEKFSSRIISVIADIKDKLYLERIFEKYKPEIVFHAAAHKHVPLMELNPLEAVKNNVWGTKNMIESSIKFDINKFVLISSDKAVNPTSVMGATKRIAELIMLNAAKNNGTEYSAVRFGNVLGSRGSVVHTFQKQINSGGPITITHPNIMRYFMTIPEAVQLVLQAFTISKGGEIFVLDMGLPVKIVDLAKDMIRLNGLKVGEDIDIKFTSLRPGEKLFEELFVSGEKYEKTEHDQILIAKNASDYIPENLDIMIEELLTFDNCINTPELLYKIRSIIFEFNHSSLSIES